jgi:hypothetical protein
MQPSRHSIAIQPFLCALGSVFGQATARRANREVEVLRDKAIDEIAARARTVTTSADATLVVGHRSTVPLIVKALGGGEIPELGSAEHDRLLVVTLLPNGGATVTTLRFEAPAQ